MLAAWCRSAGGLDRIDLEPGQLTERGGGVEIPPAALWIDLLRPLPAQVASAEALGVEIPTLEEMREIEQSNRLWRRGDLDYMTVVLPGYSEARKPVAGPVTFILGPERLVTVRHHAPQPFATFPDRAGDSSAGCDGPDRVFLGLCQEIVGRLADLLEGVGEVLDEAGHTAFAEDALSTPGALEDTLARIGRQGELLGRVRLAVLTMERALSFFSTRDRGETVRALTKAQMRDLQALTVHADHLAARLSLNVDATLGMINLAQNATVRIVSVVAALFLPPTLVASIYGMNFTAMPELDEPWGYAFALGLMVVSAVGTFIFFKWKRWL